MIDALTEPFSQGITQRALVEVLLLAAACGPLGVWVILYRQSYTAESVAHAMLPGLVVASLAEAPLLGGGGAGALLAVACIWLAGRQRALGTDAAVGVTVTALLGLGALLALEPEVPARLGEILFGDLLSVDAGDLALTGGAAAVVVAALAALHRSLSVAAFDPATAPALGVRPGLVEIALLALVALAVVVASRALGNLLAIALIIAPALAAGRLTFRLVPSLLAAAALAAAAGIAGLYLSYYLDVAAGASVALVAVAVLPLATLVRARPRRSGASPSPVEALGGTR
jgi:ABC-type Mn2+/Zn2+ transport system permease subunit